MQLHELRPKHKPKKGKRIGRGGKRGTYSGKGVKGQKSRAGRRFVPVIRSLIKRYPKLRGYGFKSQVRTWRTGTAILNLEKIAKRFKEGETVTPQSLLEKRLIRRIKGKTPKVKILGTGELVKPLNFENCSVSVSAKEKIEKAQGHVK